MTNKGIWVIIVATAFIVGTLMTNPFAEAAGGWKEAINNLGQTLGLTNSCTDGQVLKWNSATSQWECATDINTDTDTNAETICPNGTFLNGDGSCDTISIQTISCDWSGTRWASSGVDGGCAFSSGMRITCIDGVVTDISYLAGCGVFP